MVDFPPAETGSAGGNVTQKDEQRALENGSAKGREEELLAIQQGDVGITCCNSFARKNTVPYVCNVRHSWR